VRNMAEYSLSSECTKDNLTITNTKIRIRNFGKVFVNNIVEISIIQKIIDLS
jgi:hypothetical protein